MPDSWTTLQSGNRNLRRRYLISKMYLRGGCDSPPAGPNSMLSPARETDRLSRSSKRPDNKTVKICTCPAGCSWRLCAPVATVFRSLFYAVSTTQRPLGESICRCGSRSVSAKPAAKNRCPTSAPCGASHRNAFRRKPTDSANLTSPARVGHRPNFNSPPYGYGTR